MTRLYFIDNDFLVHDTPKGRRLTLRNGNTNVKTTNRIAKMCGFRKRGPLRREGGERYYELEVRNGKSKGTE